MPIPILFFLILSLGLTDIVFLSAPASAAVTTKETQIKAANTRVAPEITEQKEDAVPGGIETREASLPGFAYWRLVERGTRGDGAAFVTLELVLPDRGSEHIGATELILTVAGKTGSAGVAAQEVEHSAADHQDQMLLLDGPSPRRVTLEGRALGRVELLAKTTIGEKFHYSKTAAYIFGIETIEKSAPVLYVNDKKMEIVPQTTPVPWPALHVVSERGYWISTGGTITVQLQIPERKDGPTAAAEETRQVGQIHVVEGAGNFITTLELDANESVSYVPPHDQELSRAKTRIWKDLSFLFFSPENNAVISVSLPLVRSNHGNFNRAKGAMLLGTTIALSLVCARFFRRSYPWP